MLDYAIIGGGAWGTALANRIAGRFPEKRIRLWLRDKEMERAINQRHQNPNYLGDIALHKNVLAYCDGKEGLQQSRYIFIIVPFQSLREIMQSLKGFIATDATLIIGSKGIERDTLLLGHDILHRLFPANPLMAISGPSFAKEVAIGLPTALTLASDAHHTDNRDALVKQLSGSNLRLYASDDVAGVELLGALKNVYCIAAGMTQGARLGENARASLLCRALVEMERMLDKIGDKASLMTPAGIGDFMLSALSPTSRNTQYGMMLAKEHTCQAGQLYEGHFTTKAAHDLARKLAVDTPILDAVLDIIEGRLSVEQAATRLMER